MRPVCFLSVASLRLCRWSPCAGLLALCSLRRSAVLRLVSLRRFSLDFFFADPVLSRSVLMWVQGGGASLRLARVQGRLRGSAIVRLGGWQTPLGGGRPHKQAPRLSTGFGDLFKGCGSVGNSPVRLCQSAGLMCELSIYPQPKSLTVTSLRLSWAYYSVAQPVLDGGSQRAWRAAARQEIMLPRVSSTGQSHRPCSEAACVS